MNIWITTQVKVKWFDNKNERQSDVKKKVIDYPQKVKLYEFIYAL